VVKSGWIVPPLHFCINCHCAYTHVCICIYIIRVFRCVRMYLHVTWPEQWGLFSRLELEGLLCVVWKICGAHPSMYSDVRYQGSIYAFVDDFGSIWHPLYACNRKCRHKSAKFVLPLCFIITDNENFQNLELIFLVQVCKAGLEGSLLRLSWVYSQTEIALKFFLAWVLCC
jgi:hypothetical protein